HALALQECDHLLLGLRVPPAHHLLHLWRDLFNVEGVRSSGIEVENLIGIESPPPSASPSGTTAPTAGPRLGQRGVRPHQEQQSEADDGQQTASDTHERALPLLSPVRQALCRLPKPREFLPLS